MVFYAFSIVGKSTVCSWVLANCSFSILEAIALMAVRYQGIRTVEYDGKRVGYAFVRA